MNFITGYSIVYSAIVLLALGIRLGEGDSDRTWATVFRIIFLLPPLTHLTGLIDWNSW